MARSFADQFSKALGQPVLFVNRDGAAGRIALEQLNVAKPDGYTLAFAPAAPLTSVPHLQKGVGYRYDSFEHVCQVFENTFTISVPAGSSMQRMTDLVDRAKAAPGQLTYGHAGIGSGPHLAVESMARALGIRLQAVPYRGGNQLLGAIVAAQVDFASPGLASVAPRKEIRAIALFSAKRNPFLPDVPTLGELGLPALAGDPQGVFAPKGTPRTIVAALEQTCKTAAEGDAFKTFATKLYQTVDYLPGAELFRRSALDSKDKEALIRALRLTSD